MDWNKMGAIGSILSGLCAAALLIMAIRPSIRSRFSGGGKDRALGLRTISAFVFVSLILSAFSIYGAWRQKVPDYKHWASEKMETVYGATFENETVELDGKVFDHCIFKNVRMRFQGTAPTDFVYCRFEGSLAFDTNNVAIEDYERLSVWFQNQLGTGKPSTWLRDEHGNVHPLP